jgi:hypothetical protein
MPTDGESKFENPPTSMRNVIAVGWLFRPNSAAKPLRFAVGQSESG